jgi:hypothetical protein
MGVLLFDTSMFYYDQTATVAGCGTGSGKRIYNDLSGTECFIAPDGLYLHDFERMMQDKAS